MSELNTDDRQMVKNLEYEFLAACLSADIKKLDEILADNFIFTDPYGLNLTKAEWLEGLKSGDFTFEAIELQDLEIYVSTHIASAKAEVQIKARSKKAGYDGFFSAIDIYENLGGKWQLILSTARQLPTQT
jgi:hypothetical protein